MNETRSMIEWLEGDDEYAGPICTATLDLDPFATLDGGLVARCQLPTGHDGSHRRSLDWTDEHPDALPHL